MDLIFNKHPHFRFLLIGLLVIGLLPLKIIDDNTHLNVTISAQSDEPIFIPTLSFSPYGQCSTQEWAYLDTITSPRLYSWEDNSSADTMHSSMKLDQPQTTLETPVPLKTLATSKLAAPGQPATIQPIGLHDVAVDFYGRLKSERTLNQIDAKLPADFQHLGFVGTLTFTTNILKRLPTYRSLFERSASEHDMDWRLLAAMAYQESS